MTTRTQEGARHAHKFVPGRRIREISAPKRGLASTQRHQAGVKLKIKDLVQLKPPIVLIIGLQLQGGEPGGIAVQVSMSSQVDVVIVSRDLLE